MSKPTASAACLTSVLMALFLVFSAASLTVFSQTSPRTIDFAKLSDYVNDWDKRRNGERLIVTNVPVFSSITYQRAQKMYFFMPDKDGDVGNSFYTSSALAKSIRPLLSTTTTSIRIACTLVQFSDDFEVYRFPFATKVEGIDENGGVVWTASGTPPAKLSIRP